MAEEAVASYGAALGRDVEAVRYLRGRGFNPATASAFRLGVVAEPMPGHERFKGMLALPYLDRHGKALTVRFRCLQSHNCRDYGHGKYMTIPEDPPRMFNVRAIFEADDEISVTEGELDAMTLCMCGIPAVAIPGVHLWRDHHRRMLAGFSRVWLWGDPDEAGGEFNNRLVRAMRAAKPVRLADDDVNDTFRAGGADALYALMERSSE